MRSSKSRSRSKSNRSRSMGNIVNRVFDSSGPEGKVRGTPQQIIDKYTQLARDATLSNDRVAAENFQQHGEHYTRMLGEAQREQDARREQQEQANRDRQRERQENGQANDGGGNGQGNGNAQGNVHAQRRTQQQPAPIEPAGQVGNGQPDVIEDNLQSAPQPDLVIDPAPATATEPGGSDAIAEDTGSGLVETPENQAKPKSKPRSRTPRSRKPKAEGTQPETGGSETPSAGPTDSAKVVE